MPEGGVYSAARCKAAAAYPEAPGVSAFDRTVVHVRDQHLVFVLDRVRFMDEREHTLDAQFHVRHEVAVESGEDSCVLIRTPSGHSCRLYLACRRPSKFEQVPQPVDPYWRDYLLGYDIPPEDLEAMEQVDLRFCFDLNRACDILWMILPQGDRGSCKVMYQADASGIFLWYSIPEFPLQAVVVPDVDTSKTEKFRPFLPERPGRVFFLGGGSGEYVRAGVQQGEQGDAYRYTEAGPVCIGG